ncbi:hypothetical protein D9M71_454490 [compost metagenome]
MVVDLVEVFRVAAQELRHRPEHIVVDGAALIGAEAVADRVVALHRVDQPHRIIEGLPEQAAGNLPAPFRVGTEAGVELGVPEEYVAREVRISLVTGEPVQRARGLDGLVIALVLFVGVAAALVLGHRYINAGFHHRAHQLLCTRLFFGEHRVAGAIAAHLLPLRGGDQHRCAAGFGTPRGRVGRLGLRGGQRGGAEGGRQQQHQGRGTRHGKVSAGISDCSAAVAVNVVLRRRRCGSPV